MALIPVWKQLPIPADLQALLDRRPATWADDGLSGFPDSLLGYSISPCGSAHDMAYCGRMWPAGALDRAHREFYDAKLGEWVRAMLPFGLRWTGWLVFLAVYEFGGAKAFDSCGQRAYGANAGQMAAGLCRHGVPRPAWLR